MWRFAYAYLWVAMLFDCHRHVHRLVEKWRYKTSDCLYFAVFNIRDLLYKKGYPPCPECCWPVQQLEDHIKDVASPCHQRALPTEKNFCGCGKKLCQRLGMLVCAKCDAVFF